MRYATVRLELEDERVPPDDTRSGERIVTRERLHHFNLVDNETVVMLYCLRGLLDRLGGRLMTGDDKREMARNRNAPAIDADHVDLRYGSADDLPYEDEVSDAPCWNDQVQAS